MEYLSVPFEEIDIKEDGNQGIVKGYGSTFGGKPDSYGDIIAHGAFAESIVKNGRGGMGISMLYQHDATKPVGDWNSIMEDTRGLKMEGQLALKNTDAANVYELLKIGALKGLSIGFDLPRDKDGKVNSDSYELDEKQRTRTLKKINLWEVSLVTFPANTRAKITGVKGLQDATTVRELEKALRESGLSKSEAVYVASLCKDGLRDSGGSSEISDILDCIKGTINVLEKNIGPEVQLLNTLKRVNNMLAN